MKYFVLGMISLVSLSAVAATSPQDCIKIKNNLDRRYCVDKYLETVKDAQSVEQKAWAAGLSAENKQTKLTATEGSIAAKKEHMNLLQSEIALEEKHLEVLKAAPVAAAAAPVEPVKKKKKKGGFKIKL